MEDQLKFSEVFIDKKSLGTELADRMIRQYPNYQVFTENVPPAVRPVHSEKTYEVLGANKLNEVARTNQITGLYSADKISQINETDQIDKLDEVSGITGTNRFNPPDEFIQRKSRLVVRPFQGQFFKRCPGASQKKALPCCNYYVLNLGSGCPFDCSYCYLQSYLGPSDTTIYSNLDSAIDELQEMADQFGHLPYRIGTGEIIDSLALDPLTLFSRNLISFFKKYPAWTLEFKTKSDRVVQFLDCEHSNNVVVSWSINPPSIVDSEEHGTASLSQRLKAAQKCVQAGFPVAFHIDPMIYTADWKENYSELVQMVTSIFSPSQVSVISLGALRFQPEQKWTMKKRFGAKSIVNQSEMWPSTSGKLRYDQDLRSQMFQFVIEQFKNQSPDWKIFLCMETPEVWLSTTGSFPSQNDQIKNLFRPLPESRPIAQTLETT